MSLDPIISGFRPILIFKPSNGTMSLINHKPENLLKTMI